MAEPFVSIVMPVFNAEKSDRRIKIIALEKNAGASAARADRSIDCLKKTIREGAIDD